MTMYIYIDVIKISSVASSGTELHVDTHSFECICFNAYRIFFFWFRNLISETSLRESVFSESVFESLKKS